MRSPRFSVRYMRVANLLWMYGRQSGSYSWRIVGDGFCPDTPSSRSNLPVDRLTLAFSAIYRFVRASLRTSLPA